MSTLKRNLTLWLSRFLWTKLHIPAVPSLASRCEHCGTIRKEFLPIVVFLVRQDEDMYVYYRRVVRLCKGCGAPLVTVAFHSVIDVTNEFDQIKVKP